LKVNALFWRMINTRTNAIDVNSYSFW